MSQMLLEIRNATKIYRQRGVAGRHEVVALQDFSLAIPKQPASIITIAGESGSGKTTLAQVVLGFVNLTFLWLLARRGPAATTPPGVND